MKKSREQQLIENVTREFKAKNTKLRSELIRTIEEECKKLNLGANGYYSLFGV